MKRTLARTLIAALLLFPSITFAAPINVNGGGTGATTVPNGAYLVGGSDPLRLSATTSPTAGTFTATSTTATSSLPRLSISTAISLLGEYITNLTTWVREKIDAYLTGGQGVTVSSGAVSFDCSEVEGTGIDCVGENITLDATGAWTGTFDGLDGTAYLARANHTGTQAASTITGGTFGAGAFIFPAGVMAIGSTTVGGGTQATGLTISGGSTTTLNAYFASNVGIGTTSPTVPLHIGTRSIETPDASISMARVITGIGNGHGISDETDFGASGSYNSFDARATLTNIGASAGNHYAAFQARPKFNSGTVVPIYRGYAVSTSEINNGTTITDYYGFTFTGPTINSGSVTNVYASYIANIGAAANKWAYYAVSDKSYFGGSVGVGTTTPASDMHVANITGNQLTLSDTNASTNLKHWYIESDTGDFAIGTTSDSLSVSSPFLTIEANGEVGIGTINPAAVLDVGGGATDAGNLFDVSGTYTATASLVSNIIDFSPTLNLGFTGTTQNVRVNPSVNLTADMTSFLAFNTSPTLNTGSNTITTMRLNNAGATLGASFTGSVTALQSYRVADIVNSGSGRVLSQAGLTIEPLAGAYNNTMIFLGNANLQAGNFGILSMTIYPNVFQASSTDMTVAPLVLRSQRTAIVSGSSLGNLMFASNDTQLLASTTVNVAGVGAVSAGTHSAQNQQTDLIFTTTATGGTATNTEKVRITGAGSVGIGTTTPYAKLSVNAVVGDTNRSVFGVGSSTAAFATTTLFDVTRTGAVYAPNTTSSGSSQTGYWCYDADGQLIRTSTTCLVSALRFKENIEDMDAGLATILKLRPVTYDLKDTMGDPNNADRQFGFIAEEARDIDPRLVTRNSEGDVQSFRYEQFTAVLTKAIQEQQRQIENMKVGAVRATRSAEENWQWIVIGLLALGFAYQQKQINKLRK